MKAQDSFGPSGRAPDEKDFRGGSALSADPELSRQLAEMRASPLPWWEEVLRQDRRSSDALSYYQKELAQGRLP